MTRYDIEVMRQELVYLRGLRLAADPRIAEAAARREHQVAEEIRHAENADQLVEEAA